MTSPRGPHTLHPRDRLGRPLPPGRPDELGQKLEPREQVGSESEALERAIALFDERRFYEAHEYFEYLWNSPAVAPEDRNFWKGLAQLSAACCHVQRENPRGAMTLFGRVVDNLRPYPSPHHELDTYAIIGLARALRDVISEHGVRRGFPFLPFPTQAQSEALRAPVSGSAE
ncbi:MAG: DUF309 domain-containing protein [Myxococcaceae bacterium]|nr:DUF309 domain-containing protein [Myxococcaceae bacterium]MCI0670615.1 DUF309 domain-containing protein [Myxococcaceae bacterium]